MGGVWEKPCLTQQVLDSPRLPVSHPQTRPNQSTGPHAGKHMPRHTESQRPKESLSTKIHTDTYRDKHSQTPPTTRRATHGETQTETPHRRTSRTDPRHCGAHMCVHTPNTHGQLTASCPPALAVHPRLNVGTHARRHTSRTPPAALATPPHLPILA